LPDSAQVFYEWRTLVVQYNIIGSSVHDACLVAGMKVHDITRILTFDTGDFARYAASRFSMRKPFEAAGAGDATSRRPSTALRYLRW
jgi:hypothetical protein